MKTEWELPKHEERGSKAMLYAYILISVGLAAVAQLALKHGMNLVVERTGGAFEPTSLRSVKAVAATPMVYLGLGLFGLSAVLWLVVLSRASLSFAYPFAALTYVLILLFDRFVLHQEIPPLRVTGVGLIVAGIVLVSRTPHA
jgi:drug/metabolite transporter (DMT)-like permease